MLWCVIWLITPLIIKHFVLIRSRLENTEPPPLSAASYGYRFSQLAVHSSKFIYSMAQFLQCTAQIAVRTMGHITDKPSIPVSGAWQLAIICCWKVNALAEIMTSSLTKLDMQCIILYHFMVGPPNSDGGGFSSAFDLLYESPNQDEYKMRQRTSQMRKKHTDFQYTRDPFLAPLWIT